MILFLVLFYWAIKQDYRGKMRLLETGAISLGSSKVNDHNAGIQTELTGSKGS